PENTAIARDTRPGLNTGCSTGVGALVAVTGLLGYRGGAGRARRPPLRGTSADLVGDAASGGGEGDRRLGGAGALGRLDPRAAEVLPDAVHLGDVRHRHAALGGLAELREVRIAHLVP